MSTVSFLNDNIEIEVASLLATDGSTIDIRYSISDMTIQENIFSQCMSGSVSIMDGMSLIDKLPIVCEEFFLNYDFIKLYRLILAFVKAKL
jgi:hypothetical protein